MNFLNKYQKGYTLIEIGMLLWGLFCIGIIVAVIVIAWHFIAKFW